MRRTIFMIAGDIDVEKGGVNKVILKRSYVMANEKYKPVILSTGFKMNYPQIQSELRATAQLHADVDILNVFDYYRAKFATDSISKEEKERYERNTKKFEPDFWVEDVDSYARYFVNGTYVKYKRWNEDGRLKLIDYFDENRVRIRREEFHPSGYKIREMLFHPANNKRNQERHFTPDGFCFLTIWYNHETARQQRVFLFNPKVSKVEEFSTLKDLHTYWIAELCRVEAVKPILLCDGANLVERVQNVDDDLAFKIFMMHGNHFEAPYTLGSDYKESAKAILELIPKGYATVVLTEQQRQDLHAEIGNRGNIHVISNTVDTNVAPNSIERDSKKVVVVSRLVPAKRIAEAIEAFDIVVQAMPEATLDIYGIGEEAEALQKKVAKLKLQNHIKFKGYTNRRDEVFSSAALSLLTSKAEGQSLVMLESFINGTPVISYNINYGPAQYVRDGETGFLVENGNVEQFAAAILKALQDEQLRNEMGDQARQLAEQLCDEQLYYEKWRTLVEEVVNMGSLKPLL